MDEIADNNLDKTTVYTAPKSPSKKIILIIIVLVLVVGFSLMFWRRPNSNTLFSINGTAYSKSYVASIDSFPVLVFQISKSTEDKAIFKMIQNKTVASNLGITPDASQISTQQKSIDAQYSKYVHDPRYKTWSGLLAIDQAIQQEINSKYAFGDYRGYSYIFWFGNTVASGPDGVLPNQGDTTIYNQDKAYALSRANYYYEQLKSNKMTSSQVYAAVTVDTKLDLASQFTQSSHYGYDNTVSWTTQVYYHNVVSYIESQHATGLSSVKTGTITVNSPVMGKTEPEAYYYIAKIDKIGISSSDFKKDLNSLKVKYYGS